MFGLTNILKPVLQTAVDENSASQLNQHILTFINFLSLLWLSLRVTNRPRRHQPAPDASGAEEAQEVQASTCLLLEPGSARTGGTLYPLAVACHMA